MQDNTKDKAFAWNEAIQKMTEPVKAMGEAMPKVGHEEMATLPKIMAVDFDGTLVEDKFPEIGNPIWENIETLRAIIAAGVKVIFWSCRDNDTSERHLDRAVEYCREELGIEFDAVNCNIAETRNMFNNDTRKVYANIYWDDKAVTHVTHPLYWCKRLGLDYHETFKGGGGCSPLTQGKIITGVDYGTRE